MKSVVVELLETSKVSFSGPVGKK